MKINAARDVIQLCVRATLWCALLAVASNTSSTLARPQAAGAASGFSKMTFLSEPRDDAKPTADDTPSAAATEESNNFDGIWTFTSAGCRRTGSLSAKIVGGKIIVKGGGGQVDPDGTLHSVGAGGGMTLTAVGRLSGNTGAGTFNRSDGCVGRWIAIKR